MTYETSHFRLVKRCLADGAVLKASGRLVLGHGARWSIWAPFLEGSARRVSVDLCGITNIDAAGLGVLVRVAEETRRRHREFSINASSPALRRMLSVTGLTKPLGVGNCRPHVEAAELIAV